jgi:hypothetical protein
VIPSAGGIQRRRFAMMGRQTGDQSQLFYLFNLERRIPAGHLLRRINPVVTRILIELREKLTPFYSDIGRPSIDPELMIRMLIEKDGDGFSITSVHLTITAKIPGIDYDTFQSIAASAKTGCPVSKLMKVEIHFGATLIS